MTSWTDTTGNQPRLKVVLIVQEKTIEVTRESVHEALNLVGGVDRIPKDNATRLLAIVGNAEKGHEGYLVEQCMATYRLRMAPLVEQIYFRKKCLYVSTTLGKTMAAAERAQGNFDWSSFIRSNLGQQLTTVHSRQSLGV